LGDESAQLRFLREARAAAKVRHSNVASVFHLGRTGNSYFYAMEFVEGETIERFIRRLGRVEVKWALEITTQVAAGLAAVHEQNLVHRDIKPSNIMVRLKNDGSITAKIINLGLAKSRRVIKPRFQHPGLSLVRRSSPVPSSSQESRSISARTCIRWVLRSVRW
jgi:serine/threonine protein kinase